MALWRVDVCGVSHRYVEAATQSEAEHVTREALLDAMDVRASDAGPRLSRLYEAGGPLQRKKLLARLDGLTNPRERQTSQSALRRLEREVARARAEREWVNSEVSSAPPVSPEALDQLVRLLEVRHIELSHLRLPDWDRPPPTHGETV